MMKIFNIFLACFALSCGPQTQTVRQHSQVRLIRSVDWITDVDAASNLVSKENKPLLVYFYQDSSKQCAKMQETLNDPRVVDILNQNFVALRANVDVSTLAKMVQVKFVPALVIVVPTNDGGQLSAVMVGYHDVESFLDFLKGALA